MPTIRPMVCAARTYKLEHLTKYLNSKKIPYERTANEYTTDISFSTPKGGVFQYAFDNDSQLIRSKAKKSTNCNYETIWNEDSVSFSMTQGNKITKIKKTIEERTQSFWEKFFHSKKAPYRLTQIEKSVSSGTQGSGWTKKILQFPHATIVDIIPHRSFTIKCNGIHLTRRNVTNNIVDDAINFQLKRND